MSEGLEKRAKLVRLYLCVVRAKIEPGCRPDEPMPKKARGSSRPPVSENLLVLMKLNAVAASVLEPLIEDLKKTNTQIAGYRCDAMLWRLYEHPGSETRWGQKKRRAFYSMCRLLAKASMESDSREFSVYASVSGVKGVGEEVAATKREGWRMDVRDEYREIVAELEGFESEGLRREEAKTRIMEKRKCSRAKIGEAIAFVRRDRGNGNAA